MQLQLFKKYITKEAKVLETNFHGKCWYYLNENGSPHQWSNKPSVLSFDLKFVAFHKHGQFHRTDGPAVIEYINGDFFHLSWFRNGCSDHSRYIVCSEMPLDLFKGEL